MAGSRREKPALICAQRLALSASPFGSRQMHAGGPAGPPSERHEGAGGASGVEGIAQHIDMLYQQTTPPFEQVDGEEVGAARHTGTTIIRHAASRLARNAPKGWDGAGLRYRTKPHRDRVSRTNGGPRPAL